MIDIDFTVMVTIVLFFLSISAGVIGPFMVWRQMAYFADAIAHIALLGIALAIVFGMGHVFMVIIVASMFSFILVKTKIFYSFDTVLSIITSAVVAVAMLIFPISEYNLEGFLFGDLLLVQSSDLLPVFIAMCMCILLTIYRWKKWLLIAINEDLARVAKIKVDYLRLEFLLLVSILIAMSINVVGILLISALLVIPSSTAGLFARSPLQMVELSIVISIGASMLGMFGSLCYDLPVGPSIITSASIIMLLGYIMRNFCHYR